MKNALFLSGALAMSIAMPLVCPAQDAPAPVAETEASRPAASELTPALKSYILRLAAATVENTVANMPDKANSPAGQGSVLLESLTTAMEASMGEIPEEHQPFVKDSLEATKQSLEDLKSIVTREQNKEISAEDAEAEAEKVVDGLQQKRAAVEARYPESSKLLGQAAQERLTAEIMPAVQSRVIPQIYAYINAHPEEMADENKVAIATFRIIAKVLREMADSL